MCTEVLYSNTVRLVHTCGGACMPSIELPYPSVAHHPFAVMAQLVAQGRGSIGDVHDVRRSISCSWSTSQSRAVLRWSMIWWHVALDQKYTSTTRAHTCAHVDTHTHLSLYLSRFTRTFLNSRELPTEVLPLLSYQLPYSPSLTHRPRITSAIQGFLSTPLELVILFVTDGRLL